MTEQPDTQKETFRLFRSKGCDDNALHCHLEMEIILVLTGTSCITVDDASYKLDTGDMIFIHSGVLHTIHTPPTGECIVVQFHPELLFSCKELETTVCILPSAIVISKSSSGPRLYSDLFQLIQTMTEELKSHKILKEASAISHLLQIYVRLCREMIYENENFQNTSLNKQQEYIERFLQICSYIHGHYADTLTLETISETAGFSKFHFSRLFKQFTNMTFNDYLNQYRICKAEALLLTTSMSVVDIATHAGFSSLSNFNRAFRLFKGISPTEYRKMAD